MSDWDWNRIIGAVKGVLAAVASVVVLGSDAFGIQHATVAKTIAGVVLSALAGDAVAKNHRGAKAIIEQQDGVTDLKPPPRSFGPPPR